jgi:hypothetical protein
MSMKKYILILLIFAGCYYEQDYCVKDYSFSHPEQFKTEKNIYEWMIKNHKYVDHSVKNWLLPEETYLNGGQCTDWIILLMYFLHEINIDSELVSVYIPKDDSFHTLIKVDDKILEYSGMDNQFMFDNNTYVYQYSLSYCEAIGSAKYKF